MARVKLMANNISNLTDARYFAAQMVDYLVFTPDSIDKNILTWMLGVKEWIVGPKWLLNVSLLSLLEIEEAIQDIPFDGLCARLADHVTISFSGKRFLLVEKTSLLDTAIDTQDFDLVIEGHVSVKEYRNICANHPAPKWLEIRSQKEWVEMQPVLNIEDGIVLSGAEEEKVGYKSYDTLDLIFEMMDGA